MPFSATKSEPVEPSPSSAREAILLDLVDHLDAMVAFWDLNQVCVFANQAYRAWFGKGRAALIGMTLRELLGPALYGKNLPHIRAAYAGEKQVFERDIPTPDGGLRPSLATYIPRVVDGRVTGMYVHVADVTPLKKLERELKAAKERAEQLATHDFLTGLPNRVLMLDRLEQAMARARHAGEGMAVLTLDIDDFKKINDTWGHAQGDRCLIALAERLRRSMREGDTVLRLSGDEFLLIAPNVGSAAQAQALAGRIFDEVRQPLHAGDAAPVLTVSIGIALYPRHGATPNALLARSDQALYAAKAAGRNCSAVAA